MLKRLSLRQALSPPPRFSASRDEAAFARHYLVTGLRMSRVAALMGSGLALSFWLLVSIRVPNGELATGRQGLRLLVVCALLACAAVLYLRPRFALRRYVFIIGVPSSIVCFSIGLMSIFPPDVEHQTTTRLATAMTVACWLMYGFTRLPPYVSAASCVVSSVLVVCGALYHQDEYIFALLLYLTVANLAGWAMAVGGERRERALFSSGKKLLDMARRLAVTAAENAEANKFKTQVLAAISHDLRQPLASMSLHVKSIHSAGESEGASRLDELAGNVAACVEVMANSIDRLSEASALRLKSSPIAVGPVDLRSLLLKVEAVFRGPAKDRGVTMRVDIPPLRKLIVDSEEGRLWDVLSNLVSNSLKYMNHERNSWVVVHAARLGERVRLTVRDNGLGVDRKFHQKIFDEYFQLGATGRGLEGGYGLGLSIVRGTIEKLPRHELVFSSDLGVGARFDIFMPRSMEAICVRNVGDTSTLALEASGPLTGTYALVVEDDPQVRAALVETMESWGILVEAAGTAGEALEVVRGAERLFDVVVSDYGLPGGSDGVGLIDAVRAEQGQPTPAIILSGQVEAIDGSRLRALEVTAMSKPFDPNRLRALLEGCVAA
ncbi:ATP-binding protein [Burkholderiaceae bacterium FT117]|uniref:ATP-binding response regulator n=1 Tax=Zeimonas sediminis TaxID=2944268 RepID=UPI002342CE29|nr:hybrid sensor histidine kinase/response regulator [Zeimonas sediminis]MCM5569667.1 ATP-binding protein [Zeimonas sediminis]